MEKNKCDNCGKKYEPYNILLCKCPECFLAFWITRQLYGKHLCKECREKVGIKMPIKLNNKRQR